MRKPKPRLRRARTTEDGWREARCTCGYTFVAPVDSMLTEAWADHVHSEARLHRPLRRPLPLMASATCMHRRAVACDEAVTGDIVAWLCPDCDAQLDADWYKPLTLEQQREALAADHDQRHHGHPLVDVLGCPRCADEFWTSRPTLAM